MKAFSIKFNKSYKLTFENLQEYLMNHNVFDIKIFDNINNIDVEFQLEEAEKKELPNAIKTIIAKSKIENNELLIRNEKLKENIKNLEFKLKEKKKIERVDIPFLEKKVKTFENKLISYKQTAKEISRKNTVYRNEIKMLKKRNEKLENILSGIEKAARPNQQPVKNN